MKRLMVVLGAVGGGAAIALACFSERGSGPVAGPAECRVDSAGVWGSADLTSGDRFSHTFATPGKFPYHCIPHQTFMRAKLVVQ